MIDHLDHLVLTTTHEKASVDFYTRVMQMQLETFVGGTPPVTRQAFRFGNQKINLHVKGHEFDPKAHLPVPGALDLCFIASQPLEQVIAHLHACQWPYPGRSRDAHRCDAKNTYRCMCATPI